MVIAQTQVLSAAVHDPCERWMHAWAVWLWVLFSIARFVYIHVCRFTLPCRCGGLLLWSCFHQNFCQHRTNQIQLWEKYATPQNLACSALAHFCLAFFQTCTMLRHQTYSASRRHVRTPTSCCARTTSSRTTATAHTTAPSAVTVVRACVNRAQIQVRE